MKGKIQKTVEIIIIMSTLIGLILMFNTVIKGKIGIDLQNAIIDYFFYFTTLSNIFVLMIFVGKFFQKTNNDYSIYNNSSINGAVAAYISLTGLIYFFLLRGLYNNLGVGFEIAKILLHYVTPISGIFYWFIYMSEKRIKFVNIFFWYIFPLVYFLIILIRGSIIAKYPYPFFDILKIGYLHVIINSIFITFAFFVLGLIFIVISKLRGINI